MNKEEATQIWNDFKDNIQYKNRFFIGREIIEILDTFPFMPMFSDAPKLKFWRARIGNYVTDEDSKILAPPVGMANAGRCNPKGISYLYLSMSKESAVSEVKPNKGDYVTVAEIEIEVDKLFSFLPYNKEYMKPYLNNQDVQYLMDAINIDLESVVTQEKIEAYLPLQFIAEYIKNKGFNGFAYGSTMGNSLNVVLFNWEGKVKVKSKQLVQIENVTYSIKPLDSI